MNRLLAFGRFADYPQRILAFVKVVEFGPRDVAIEHTLTSDSSYISSLLFSVDDLNQVPDQTSAVYENDVINLWDVLRHALSVPQCEPHLPALWKSNNISTGQGEENLTNR